jgi:hypothetical protein
MTDTHDTDKLFAGSIPDIYDTYLLPLIFQTYAVAPRGPRRVASHGCGLRLRDRVHGRLLAPAVVQRDLPFGRCEFERHRQHQLLGTRVCLICTHDALLKAKLGKPILCVGLSTSHAS